MTDETPTAVPVADFARLYVEKFGIAVVQIPPGKKYPTHDDWEQEGGYFTDPQAAHDFYTKKPKWGAGAVLGPSRLCSLDIDNLEESRLIFGEFGIDIDAMADQYPTIVGNPARFRIEFRVPDGVKLSTHRVQWPNPDNLAKMHTVFELRSGLVQDVLPPTIHPDTKQPYRWRTQPKNGFLDLPPELLNIWLQWDVFVNNARAMCPWALDRPVAPPPKKPKQTNAGPSVIEAYCQANDLHSTLEKYGYKRMGKRYLSPHSSTKLPGCVVLDDNRVWIHHASDPLGGDHPINAFDLYLYYEHSNDLSAATRAAALELGIAHKTKAQLQMERAANNPAPLPANVDPETGEILDSAPETPAPKKQSKEPDRPFTPLGFDHGVYYYLASGTQQVTGLTASQHSKANLIQLAPLQYWEREFPAKKGAEWDVAMNTLMRQCEARGVFSPSILRGRGAWYDDGRVMVHLGDQVMVDNDPFKPGRVPSRFVYEARLAMRADVSNPLTAQEAQKYVKLLEMAAWEKPIYATFAAGWCAVAHIGGVLTWRPHIWVVGRRGSGKTHVMSKMIRPVLGDNLLHAQGDTSEAGLRQSLGIDSLPVLFDEAEGPDQRSNERVQNVLSLVRQSSSETGGKILKGTISGRSMEFAIRSCFAFSSINANIMQQSDRSRVTVLELNQEHGKHSFADILKAEADLLSDEYVQRFYARSLAMASTIRHNAEAFAAAAATVLGEQRAGDQIGTLLAGAFSLESDALVTAAEAEAWVAKRDWTEQREEAHSQSDEKMLWKYLLERRVSVNTSRGREDIQVGKLIHYGCGGSSAYSPISVDDAQKVLLTIGMRIGIEQQSVLVSNSHSRIKEMLEGTAWAHNWSRVLKRLPKAEASNSAIYFGFKGSESRAVQVQIDVDMME